MNTSDPLFHKGHRQRLRDKIDQEKITDYELLEYFLTLVIKRQDVRRQSRELLKRFGSYRGVLTAPADRLMEVEGIGPKCTQLIAALRESALIEGREALIRMPIFENETNLVNYCVTKISGKPVEEFHVLYLDKSRRLISDEIHTMGSVDTAILYPVPILRRALYLNATGVVVVHNHPSGRPVFSDEDILATQEIINILYPYGIYVYDHYLVNNVTALSLRRTGYLNESGSPNNSVPEQNPTPDCQI